MEARGSGPGWRSGAVAILTARVLATLGAFKWIVAAASFGGPRRRAEPRIEAPGRASIGPPGLVGSGPLAIAGVYLQRPR